MMLLQMTSGAREDPCAPTADPAGATTLSPAVEGDVARTATIPAGASITAAIDATTARRAHAPG
jgi:hypothetical protein